MSLDFSILIATHNRADMLPDLLDRFSQQDVGAYRGELILVDNASIDETPHVLSNAQCKIPLIHLTESSPGKNKALNLALKHALGRLLIFTDDDVIPAENWVLEFLQGAERWPSDSVFCGPIQPKLPPGTAPWVHRLEGTYFAPLYGGYHPIEGDQDMPVEVTPFGANLAVRAEAIQNLAYDEMVGPQGTSYAMGSESEMLRRLRGKGCRFIYLPKADLQHIVREDQVQLPWMLRRAYSYGRGGAYKAFRDNPGECPSAWRRSFILARLWLKSTVYSLAGDEWRFRTAWFYHFWRGYQAELRQLTRGVD